MGKSHDNMINVMMELSRYTQNNESFLTVSDLHQYMNTEMSERTVRRCLDTLERKALVDTKEIGNSTVYVVYEQSLLPDSDILY